MTPDARHIDARFRLPYFLERARAMTFRQRGHALIYLIYSDNYLMLGAYYYTAPGFWHDANTGQNKSCF